MARVAQLAERADSIITVRFNEAGRHVQVVAIIRRLASPCYEDLGTSPITCPGEGLGQRDAVDSQRGQEFDGALVT